MKLLPLIIVLLPLFVTCCSFEKLSLDGDLNYKTQYPNDCINEPSVEHFAVCVTQRNSLINILECANIWQGTWRFQVPEGSLLDNDVVSTLSVKNEVDDGWLIFTAKDLLYNVAQTEACINTRLDFAKIFDKCPFQDKQTFMNCLCCERVEDYDIQQLHNCLATYDPPYALLGVLTTQPDFVCRGTCDMLPNYYTNLCPRGTLSHTYNSREKLCRFWRTEKGPYPPKSVRPREYTDDETDEGEEFLSDLDMAQFSDFPDFPDFAWTVSSTTETSMTRTVSTYSVVTTGLSLEVNPTGTPTHFATRNPSPSSSSGVTYMGRDHALLGSILVFVGILHHVL